MDADIRLDGNVTTVEGDILETTANDVVVDCPSRRIVGGGQRRALVHDFHDGLTLNWQGDYPGGVTIDGAKLTCHTADLLLDSAGRRKNATPLRRALVHDFNDGLTINWAHDYPGGVTINGPLQINGNVHVKGSFVVDNPIFGPVEVGDLIARMQVHIDHLTARLDDLDKLEG